VCGKESVFLPVLGVLVPKNIAQNKNSSYSEKIL